MLLSSRKPKRKAAATVVVVAFLALFAVVGLTFLIVSMNSQQNSQIYRQSQYGGHSGVAPLNGTTSDNESPPWPTSIMNTVLGYTVYDVPEPGSGVYDSNLEFVGVKGHSLARAMYGSNPAIASNTQSYNGVGRLSGQPLPSNPAVVASMTTMGLSDDRQMINYTSFPADGFIRDAEYYPAQRGAANRQRVSFNPNYTYPDENNMPLAAVDQLTGRVMVPSYHRQWLVNNVLPPANQTVNAVPAVPVAADTNPWTNAAGKYLMLRPRPVDHQWPPGSGLSEFPYPTINADGTIGDVENLSGKYLYLQNGTNYRQNDSVWLDFNLPVQRWNGKNYKPLVAMLITDLDSRINLNIHGNLRSPTQTHNSNQGWGMWEVNAEGILGADQVNALRSVPSPSAHPGSLIPGRYGQYATLSAPIGSGKTNYTFANETPGNFPNNLPLAHFYSPIDKDGSYPVGGTPLQWRLPGLITDPNAVGFETSPVWGPARNATTGDFSPSNRYHSGFASESLRHPSLFNPYFVRSITSANNLNDATSRTFGVEEMRLINGKFQFDVNNYRKGSLGKLANATIGSTSGVNAVNTGLQQNPADWQSDSNVYSRFMTTVLSNDIERPGATPWYRRPAAVDYQFGTGPTFPSTYPIGTPVNFSLAGAGNADHDAAYRAWNHVSSAIDVGRRLTDYRLDITQPYAIGTNTSPAQRAAALIDRQNLAQDIFDRLRMATSPADLSAAPGTPAFDALRFLAQLAVNIVDYIDSDDVMTVFNWNPAAGNDITNEAHRRNAFVVGCELSRLVINESFTYFENDLNDQNAYPGPMMMQQATNQPMYVKNFLELHNPLTPLNAMDVNDAGATTVTGRTSISDGGNAILTHTDASTGVTTPIYRIVVTRTDSWLNSRDNVFGNPNLTKGTPNTHGEIIPATHVGSAQNIQAIVTFAPGTMVTPNFLNDGTQGYGPNNSFMVVTGDDINRNGGAGVGNPAPYPFSNGPATAPTLGAGLNYLVPNAEFEGPGPNGYNTPWRPTFLLQRLADPHSPASAANPYITTDFYETTDLSWINDRTISTPTGTRAAPLDWNTMRSYGRREPYYNNGQNNTLVPTHPGIAGQNLLVAPVAGETNHTFRRHNGRGNTYTITDPSSDPGNTLNRPFGWMIHLDRAPISSSELIHCSCMRPCAVHWNFFFNNGRYNHTANWYDELNRLYRAFDYVTVSSRIHSMPFGGRVPGKININTIYNKGIFDAVTGRTNAQQPLSYNYATGANVYPGAPPGTNGSTGTNYTGVDVDRAWNRLIGTRWNNNPASRFNGFDVPLQGSMNRVEPGHGINRTIFRPGMFTNNSPTDTNVYGRNELMQTVQNVFTTRSNCFAVYATIGYFEVKNQAPYTSTNRPILGKELNIESGRNVRHRFFAVVDRTNLAIDMTVGNKQARKPVYLSYEPVAVMSPAVRPVTVNGPETSTAAMNQVKIAVPFTTATATSISGVYENVPWTITVGKQVRIGHNNSASPFAVGMRNLNQFATVSAITQSDPLVGGLPTMTLTLTDSTMLLPRGSVICMDPDTVTPPTPGNPGPQPQFNYNSSIYKGVVPLVEQLD